MTPDPDEPDREPDYRFTLANERTFLAWARTALALTGGGIAIVHVVPELAGDVVRSLLGVPLAIVGGIVPAAALWRWRRVQAAMRRDVDLPPTLLPPIVGVLLLVVSGAVLALLASGRLG